MENKISAKRDIAALRSKANALPRAPGVYIMHGKSGEVIYIGKSRSLRDRVSQYFHGSHDTKTSLMAESVYDFEFIVCSTEMEALSLENKLIKHHTPKYNIRLKDAKSYPYIKVNYKTEYPSISMTRSRLADGAMYFGPYSSTTTVYSVISSLEKSLGLPSCKRKFPKDIGKGRPCVNYQIGRCTGLCTGNVTKEMHRAQIDTAIDILKGGTSGAIRSLTEDMIKHAENEEFELAAKCRDSIASLKKLGEKQTVITSPDVECDVFGFCPASETVSGHDSMSVFYIRSGYIADREHYLFDDVIIDGDADESQFTSIITRIYADREYIPREILLSFELSDEDHSLVTSFLSEKADRKVTLRTPKRAASKALCLQAVNDAKLHAENKVTIRRANEKMLTRLADTLKLEVFPERIEAYDVSNLGSEHITAGMVTAINGSLKKSEYRSFKIRSINAPDDYFAMTEAILRRMAHTRGENTDSSMSASPDLILLDGGIGHVSVISQALTENGYYVPVFGMVKDEHHKTRTLVSADGEIDVSRMTDVFKFVYSLQEEVHRYTVGLMSKAKRKTLKTSSLEKIDGIGKAKAKKLLSHFKTLSNIKNASVEELCKVKGISRSDAVNVAEYYNTKPKG